MSECATTLLGHYCEMQGKWLGRRLGGKEEQIWDNTVVIYWAHYSSLFRAKVKMLSSVVSFLCVANLCLDKAIVDSMISHQRSYSK